MANGITSEWEDIHVKRGNYEARPTVTPQSELQKEAQEKILANSTEDYLKFKKDSELDEFEDEFEDDDFVKQYMEKRSNEIKEQSKLPYFGQLLEISRDQYLKEVNEAPADVWVVLNLYQEYNEISVLFNQWLSDIARKHTHVKFIKIVATKCVENFPDTCVPCLIIYRNGKVASHLQNADKFLRELKQVELERFLHQHSVIKDTQFEELEEDDITQQGRNILKQPFKQNKKEEVEDDIDDREYTNEKLKAHKRF